MPRASPFFCLHFYDDCMKSLLNCRILVMNRFLQVDAKKFVNIYEIC